MLAHEAGGILFYDARLIGATPDPRLRFPLKDVKEGNEKKKEQNECVIIRNFSRQLGIEILAGMLETESLPSAAAL